MPNRILREGILTSDKVARLGWAAEVFYRRLMSVADDYGRFHALAKLLRAACYPLQIDKVSDADIGKWLSECETAGLVSVYPAQDGKRYIQIANFGQQVRAKSKFPDAGDAAPLQSSASNCEQVPAVAHLVVSEFVSVSEGVVGDSRKRDPRAKSKKTAMPEGFAVSARVAAWAKEKSFDRVDEHLQAFARKCAANGYQYADWDAALMEAIREDWAKLRVVRGAVGGFAPAAAVTAPSAAAEQTAALLAQQAEAGRRANSPEAQAARLAAMAKVKGAAHV
jgi:hypothetical protein